MSDAIPLDRVKVIGSRPEVLGFPIAAKLISFGLRPGAMSIRSSGAEAWPAVSIDGGEPVQSGTLWIFLNIDGQWYATGAERLRPTQTNGDKPEADEPGAILTLVGSGWLFDPNRWGVMSGYNPAPGEGVGVMLVAGSTRSDNNTPVQARSNVLLVEWPGASGRTPLRVIWDESAPVLDPDPPPPPPPPPPAPVPADLSGRLDALAQAIGAVAAEQQAQRAMLAELLNRH